MAVLNEAMLDLALKLPLFQQIPRHDLAALLAIPGCDTSRFPRGAIVAMRGDAYEKLFMILSGCLAAELQDQRGKILKVETLKEGEAVATAILFSTDNILPVTLKASTDVHLLEIPKPAVLALMQKNTSFLHRFLTNTGDKLAFLAEKLYLQQFSTIAQRLAAYLLDQAVKQNSDRLQLKVTKEVLAEMFGVARPSLSRCFSELQQKGIVDSEGRSVRIRDRGALRKLLESE